MRAERQGEVVHLPIVYDQIRQRFIVIKLGVEGFYIRTRLWWM